MSLILDALRKSEQERQAKQQNQQQTGLPPSPRIEPITQSRPIFTYLLIIVLTCLITLAIAYQWFVRANSNLPVDQQTATDLQNQAVVMTQAKTNIQSPTPLPQITRTTPKPHNSIALPKTRAITPPPRPRVHDVTTNNKPRPFKQAIVTPTVTSKPLKKGPVQTQFNPKRPSSTPLHKVSHLKDMPEALQKQIPPLNYSSHWYDKNAQQRNIIINNRSFHEGEWVTAQLMLKSIQTNGAVFVFNKQFFQLPLLESWPNKEILIK